MIATSKIAAEIQLDSSLKLKLETNFIRRKMTYIFETTFILSRLFGGKHFLCNFINNYKNRRYNMMLGMNAPKAVA